MCPVKSHGFLKAKIVPVVVRGAMKEWSAKCNTQDEGRRP